MLLTKKVWYHKRINIIYAYKGIFSLVFYLDDNKYGPNIKIDTHYIVENYKEGPTFIFY